jgi:hypothetical protein
MLACAAYVRLGKLTEYTNGECNEVASTQLEDIVHMTSKTKSEEYHKYDGSRDGRSVVIEDKLDLSIVRVGHFGCSSEYDLSQTVLRLNALRMRLFVESREVNTR